MSDTQPAANTPETPAVTGPPAEAAHTSKAQDPPKQQKKRPAKPVRTVRPDGDAQALTDAEQSYKDNAERSRAVRPHHKES